MAGSLQKKKGSKYYYAVIPYLDDEGNRKQKWIKTGCAKKVDAERFLIDLQHKIQHGTFINPSKILLTDFLGDWLDNIISSQVEQTTLEGYETCIMKHIIP